MEALVTKTAGDLALQGSGWACAVILGVCCYLLSKRINELHAQFVRLITTTTTTAERGTSAILAQTAALERMQAAQTTAAQALQEQSHETATEIREVRHAVGNHHASVNAIVNLLVRRDQGAA
jgi:hypothetical protein